MLAVMEGLSLVERRKTIELYWKANKTLGKAAVVKHFVSLGVPQQTVYRLLAKLERGQTVERKPGSGRPAAKLPPAARRRVVKQACDKKGVSVRKLAGKFGVSKSYVHKTLKEAGVKHFKRQSAPHWTPELEERQKKCLRKLNRTFCQPSSPVEIVMDDESYFVYKNDKTPGNDGYHTQDKENTPPSVKYKTKKKFEPKLLVWVAISERGHSDVYFRKSGLAVNGEVYRQHCIRDRLKPFIQEVHGNDEIIFWPDLASSHYARATLQLLDELEIPYVPRDANPPNVPKLRPVEDFWGILKGLVYRGGWEAKTERQLKQRVKKCLDDMDWGPVQAHLQRLKTDIRKAADGSPRDFL